MIEKLAKEIRQALDAELYLVAVQATLTLPDICGMIQFPRVQDFRKRYIAWYKDSVIHSGPMGHLFDGEVAWMLRCEILHNFEVRARFRKVFSKEQEFPFYFCKGEKTISWSGVPEFAEISERTFNPHMVFTGVGTRPVVFTVNPEKFCLEIVSGVDTWVANLSDDQRNRMETHFGIYVSPAGPFREAPQHILAQTRR